MSKSLFLRPPETLHERIAASAKSNKQSMNQRAIALLERALQIEEQGYREAAIQRAIMALRDGGVAEGIIEEALRCIREGRVT